MSEENTQEENTQDATQEASEGESQAPEKQETSNEVQLSGIYAKKVGMTSVYSDKGAMVPVTLLKYQPWVVTQVKTKDKEGYEAVQIAADPKKGKRTLKSEKGHFEKAGFENGAKLCKEIRQDLPEGVSLGQKVSLSSLAVGDFVKITGQSKGRGFAGAMKRHGFGGGPASHGSKFHRRPGSIGNCTDPGRVMPGRKMPGHFGNETVSVKRAQVIDVDEEQNVLLVKGPVPGARNSMVRLLKV